ncbi:MAG: hypothetical protein QOE56_1024 [Solirubrobacterales bacterium]|jgi:hypothetical protein|nr:hypothetical protein [Solirubrobacterales bacterium]
MSLPILAVDVDGVISLFGFEQPPDSADARFELVDGMMHCISLPAGRRLSRLSKHYELIWATGWEDKANYYLPLILGLPELPHLTFDGAARFGTAHWKLGPLEAYCRGRAMAWIDDNFDESCYEWARARPEPTLLVPTEAHVGLEEAETEALIAWASGLD